MENPNGKNMGQARGSETSLVKIVEGTKTFWHTQRYQLLLLLSILSREIHRILSCTLVLQNLTLYTPSVLNYLSP